MRRWVSGAVVALMLVAGACGGAGDEAADRIEDPDQRPLTPLAAYLDPGEDSQTQFDRWRTELSELIAACMQERGFDYVPTDFTQVETFVSPLESLTDAEFAEQYGFGISTTLFDERFHDPGTVIVDPNEAVYGALSDSEQAAWDLALFGDPEPIDADDPRMDPSSEEFDPDFVPGGGCNWQAQKILGQPFPGEHRFASLRQTAWEQIKHDPRMIAAQANWARCLAEAGYPYESVDDIEREISRQLEPVEVAIDSAAQMTPEEFDALITGLSDEELDRKMEERRLSTELPPELERHLAGVRAFELAAATAAHTCRVEVGLDDVRYEVTVEVEQQLVDQHLDELEAFLTEQDRQ